MSSPEDLTPDPPGPRAAREGASFETRLNALGQPVGWPVDRRSPVPRPARTPMVGRWCRLDPLARGDLPALFDAFAEDRDGEGWTYLPHGPFDGAEDFAADMAPRIGGDDPIFFTIRAEGRPVGHAAYLRIDPGSAAVEVGFIHYAPALQRRPAATEAMALMMARAFETGYRRYEWKCDALNAPSRRAAERLGFTYEGTFRQATHYKGRNRDTAWFSILDREWPARRVRLAAWLDPANFDAEGRQRARL